MWLECSLGSEAIIAVQQGPTTTYPVAACFRVPGTFSWFVRRIEGVGILPFRGSFSASPLSFRGPFFVFFLLIALLCSAASRSRGPRERQKREPMNYN